MNKIENKNFLKIIISKILYILKLIKKYYKNKINNIVRDDRFSLSFLLSKYKKPWYTNIKIIPICILFLLNIIYRFFVEIVLLLILILVSIYLSVSMYTNRYTHSDISHIEQNNVALVLGTSKYISKNKTNRYYINRIDAAYDLYISGKANHILVSGDNRSHRYNEPQTMFNDLVSLGIPENRIYLDYAGFRTYDSIVRAQSVFGQSKFTVVSQKFHNERAIFIARARGIEAIGYNAKDVPLSFRLVQMPREMLSRALMYFDIIIGRHPYFYGEPVIIGGESI